MVFRLYGVPITLQWLSSRNAICMPETQVIIHMMKWKVALRDWLFGCNPWGTTMIVGMPQYGDYPLDPHSSLSVLHHYRLDGGLVDGPVYNSIYKNLKGYFSGRRR